MIVMIKNWVTRYLSALWPHRRRYRGWGELIGLPADPLVRVVGAYRDPARQSVVTGTDWIFRWQHPVTGGIVESHEINFA